MSADAERAVTALRLLVGAAPEPLGLLKKADARDDQRKAEDGYHPCGVCDIRRELCEFCTQGPPPGWETG